MPPTFDDLRTRLPEVNIFWEGGSVEYVRDVPRGWGTAGPRWSIGFVLNTVEAHEGWVDRPLFTRMPLRPGMGWLIPPWTGAYARWHEPCDYVHIELDQSLFADLSVRPEVVRPGLQVVDDTVVALGLALLMSPAADDPLYGEAVSHALARHLARRHAGAQRTPTFWGRGELRAAFDYVEANLGEPLSLQRNGTDTAGVCFGASTGACAASTSAYAATDHGGGGTIWIQECELPDRAAKAQSGSDAGRTQTPAESLERSGCVAESLMDEHLLFCVPVTRPH